ncbi:MAG: hypothetical protein WBV94_15085 [Blastocatellia bacterium]
MINQKLVIKISLILVVLTLANNSIAQTPCYPDAPPGLVRLVDIVAENATQAGVGAAAISSKYTEMIAWAVADARSGSMETNIKNLEAYRYLGETARTDKQVGASATSGGTTSAIEKPGLVNLLGFAVEHGAIQQNLSDTAVTLSTSPYALIALVEGDTPDTYKRYELFNRLGVSATFNLNDKDNVLANVSRKQLTEWSAKLRLTGDRSTRSPKFQAFWDKNIGPVIQQRVDVTQELRDTVSDDDNLEPLTDIDKPSSLAAILKTQVANYLQANPTDTPDKKRAVIAAIKQMILCHLKELVYDRVKSGDIKLSTATLDSLNSSFTNLARVHSNIAEARQKLEDFLKTFMVEGTLSTFAYTNHRVEMGSDYSEFKLLFERHVAPLDIVANANLSIYDKPDPMKNQERIRDFSGSISLEGSSKNPLRSISEDLSRITYSFTGRYERLKENEDMPGRKPDIASAQFKIELPIAIGISIPVAYTYSSATEMSMKKENRFNIGLHLDVDKLFATRRAANR